MLDSIERWCCPLEDARVLDLGCGDGASSVLLAAEPVRLVVGLDLRLRLFEPDDEGELTRRLIERIAEPRDRSWVAEAPAQGRPASFVRMNATRLGFRAGSFDLVVSRSAAEHIQPIEAALRETFRIVRPGGLVYLGIDPFFWLRGCHKRGGRRPLRPRAVVPARVSAFRGGERRRSTRAPARPRLATLNRFTVSQWRRAIECVPWEVLEWKERASDG